MTVVDTSASAVDRVPAPGDMVHIGADASVQFAGDRALLMAVLSVRTDTWEGWCWLAGYEVGLDGGAYGIREVFVRIAGLLWVDLEEHRRLYLDLPDVEDTP